MSNTTASKLLAESKLRPSRDSELLLSCVWRDMMLTLAGSPFLLYMLSVRREDPDHSRPQLLTATHDLSAIPILFFQICYMANTCHVGLVKAILSSGTLVILSMKICHCTRPAVEMHAPVKTKRMSLYCSTTLRTLKIQYERIHSRPLGNLSLFRLFRSARGRRLRKQRVLSRYDEKQ